jgi:hypothetical protein
MPNDEGETIGVYVGPGAEELLDDFDALDGTRSANLRRAMALLVAVDDAMAARGEPLDEWDERALRATVRQSVLDHLAEE